MPADDRFVEILERPRRRWRWWQITLVALSACVVLGGLTAGGVIWHFSQDLPSLDSLQNYQPSLVTTVYSDNHQPIGQFFIERRILTPLGDMPKSLTQAVIATEDARFFEHPGLDYVGILRAAWTNIRHGGKKVEGASTITQQLARSLFLSSERADSGLQDGSGPHEGTDPGNLSESDLLRTGSLRRGVGRPDVFRERYFPADPRGVRVPCGTAEIAEPVFALHGL
jgi:hypothetical protein